MTVKLLIKNCELLDSYWIIYMKWITYCTIDILTLILDHRCLLT